MKYCLLAIVVCTVFSTFAQTTRRIENGKEVTFTYVEQMPKAGYDLNEYLAKNLHFPDTVLGDNAAEKVVVKFAVNEDGSITDATIIKGAGKAFDKEVLRVIGAMPAWIPGRQHGKPTRVMYALPVSVHLQHQK